MKPVTPSAIEPAQTTNPSLPQAPDLSSWKAGWDKLSFCLYHSDPFREAEFHVPYHIICINHGKTTRVQANVDGQSETNDWVPGGIGIFPAEAWQFCEWYEASTFVDLCLEPVVINHVALELCEKDEIELVPVRKSGTDPLIYEISSALKAVLEGDGSGSKLYVDAMANALAVHLLLKYSTRKISVKGLPRK